MRWCLLFYTRCNTAAWDELANILHLPSGRTLQGYRNNNLTRGACEETINRYASKQAIIFEKELRELRSAHATEKARNGVETAEQMAERHEEEVTLLKIRQAWGMKGTLAFDSMKIRQQFLWNSKENLIEGFEGDFEGAAAAEMSVECMLEQREHTIATELMVSAAPSLACSAPVHAPLPCFHFAPKQMRARAAGVLVLIVRRAKALVSGRSLGHRQTDSHQHPHPLGGVLQRAVRGGIRGHLERV